MREGREEKHQKLSMQESWKIAVFPKLASEFHVVKGGNRLYTKYHIFQVQNINSLVVYYVVYDVQNLHK